jgi:hypothetical protein
MASKGQIAALLICLVLPLVWAGCAPKQSDAPITPPPDDNQDPTGTIYYVATTGNDSNPGTAEQPWRTPGYASRQLAPGDKLIIKGGRYILSEYDAHILTPPDGTVDKTITIEGEEGHRPVLAGKDNLAAAIRLSSYLTIKNIEITSHNGAWFRDAIMGLDLPISHVTLQDLSIHHIDEFGVNIADVNHLTIDNCAITYTGIGSIGGPDGQHGGWRNILINGCQLSYNGHYYRGGPGPGFFDRPDGFGIEPSSGPIEIRDTTAQHNLGDGLDSKAANTFIHHCIIANNRCDGIKLWRGDSKVENCLIYGTGDGIGGHSPWAGLVIEEQNDGDTFEIINVTIHDNPTRRAYSMYAGYNRLADISITMRNCVISGGYGAAYFGPRVQTTFQYNIFHRPNNPIQVEANNREYTITDINSGFLGPGNLYANPQFTTPAWGTPGDYHLLPTSPIIDKGTTQNAPTTDLDYTPRPQGQSHDPGAYEK